MKDGRVFYNKGFGSTGVKGHVKASKARAARDKAKAEADEALAKKKMHMAGEQAQQFLTEGAAALLRGVNPEDGDAMMDGPTQPLTQPLTQPNTFWHARCLRCVVCFLFSSVSTERAGVFVLERPN